jgi:hypothetical protein
MRRRLEIGAPLLQEELGGDAPKHEWELAVGEYPELGPRIAAAAACSSDWDPRTGAPRSGEPGAALAKLLRDDGMTREVGDAVRRLGYRSVVASADAVVLCRWNEIDVSAGEPSCRPTLQPTSLVPCGGSLLFRLRPE